MQNAKQLVYLLIAVMLVIATGCQNATKLDAEEATACGTGTVFDETTNSCVADLSDLPDFNRVIDEVALGDFTLSNVEVPDELVEGGTAKYKLTITNNTIEDKPITMLRLAVAGTDSERVDTYLSEMKTAGTVCTNSCPYWWLWQDGHCEDGGDNSSYDWCQLGTDCADCGPRKGMLSKNEDDQCDESGFSPEPYTGVCHMKVGTVGMIRIDNLEAGTSKEITYTASVPYSPDRADVPWKWESNENTLIFAVNEQQFVLDENGYPTPDPAQQKWPGMVQLEYAEAIAQVGSVKVTPAEEAVTLVAGSERIDRYAFELPSEMYPSTPLFTVQAKVIGTHVRRLKGKAELKLPGHSADETTYNASRKFDLLFQDPHPPEAHQDRGNMGFIFELLATCKYNDTCDSIGDGSPYQYALPHGQVVDTIFQFQLTPEDRNSLSRTLRNRSLNPDLNDNDEIAGKLLIELDPKDGDEETIEIDVVFMAPPANPDANYQDPNAPEPTTPQSDLKYASGYTGGTYPDKSNLTPQFFHKFGGDTIGAEVNMNNTSSREWYHEALIKQAVNVDNYAAINLFGNKVYLVKIDGMLDWGARRRPQDNKFSASMRVIKYQSSLDQLLQSALTSDNFVEATTYLLLNLDFDSSAEGVCVVDSSNAKKTTCTAADTTRPSEQETQRTPSIDSNAPYSFADDKSAMTYTITKDKEMCYSGIICIKGELSAAFTVGMDADVQFVRDTQYNPRYTSELRATVGPYATVDGSAMVQLDIGIAATGLTGTLNFFDLAFTPELDIKLEQELETGATEAETCWMRNHGNLGMRGWLKFKALGGELGYFVDLGPKPVDMGAFTVNLRFRVVDEKIVSWDPPINRTWLLWNRNTPFRGGDGLCDDANTNTFWKSPTSCTTLTGAEGYCPNSFTDISRDSYNTAVLDLLTETGYNAYAGMFHPGPSQCGTITLNGRIEPSGSDYGDRLIFAPAYRIFTPEYSHCRVEYEYTGMQGKYKGAIGEVICDETYPYFPTTNFSGFFDDTKIRFCNTTNTDLLSSVYFWLVTDGGISEEGITMTVEYDDQPEEYFVLDDSWWAVTAHITEPGLEESDTNDWRKLDYLSTNFHSAQLQPGKTNSYYGTATGGDNYNYFRRAFISASKKYVISSTCDDICEYYLDGEPIGKWDWNDANNQKDFEFDTVPGETHMLAVKHLNSGSGYHFEAIVHKPSNMYSDKTWLVHRGTLADDIYGNSWYQPNYTLPYGAFTANASELGKLDDGTLPWGSLSASSPFESDDAGAANWIWAPHPDMQVPAESVYYRKEFIAVRKSYTAHVRCDNRCDIYLDGSLLGTHDNWSGAKSFTFSTQVGRNYLLAIKATNDAVGPAGLNWMMK